MRELLWMVEARQRCEWAQMSNLMALLANINRDPKKSKVFKPTDFNPYYVEKKERVTITKENMDILRQAVVGVTGLPTNPKDMN
jgi:hypothetical protein